MEAIKQRNGKRVVFSEKTFEQVANIISRLNKRLKARLIVFADVNGYPICYDGNDTDQDISALTALAAGTFSATSEMAKLIGEENPFKFIYHEGTHQNIYFCQVSSHYFMMVLFDKSVVLGMVRVLVHKTVHELQAFVAELAQKNEKAKQFLDIEFKSLLNKELDKHFGAE